MCVYVTHAFNSFWHYSYVFMMSEARWTAVQNVVFFSKGSIVIKLTVKGQPHFLFLSNTMVSTVHVFNWGFQVTQVKLCISHSWRVSRRVARQLRNILEISIAYCLNVAHFKTDFQSKKNVDEITQFYKYEWKLRIREIYKNCRLVLVVTLKSADKGTSDSHF